MSNQAAKPVLIQAEKLADGVTSTSRPGQAILVQNSRITAVGDRREIQRQAPPDTQTIDLGEACLAPGLIDGHTHLSLAGDGRVLFGDSCRGIYDQHYDITGLDCAPGQ